MKETKNKEQKPIKKMKLTKNFRPLSRLHEDIYDLAVKQNEAISGINALSERVKQLELNQGSGH